MIPRTLLPENMMCRGKRLSNAGWGAVGLALLLLLGARTEAAGDAPGPDAVAVDSLLKQSEALDTTAPEQALALAQQARQTATTETQRLRADARLAFLQRLLTNYPAAIELAAHGLQRAKELQDPSLQAQFHYVLARTEWNLGNYPASTESFLAAINAATSANAPAIAFDAHVGFSTLFVDLKQPEQAEFHLKQARVIAEQLGDKVRLGDLHKVSGNNALAQKNYDRARQEQEISLRLHQEAGSDRGVADALQNLGFAIEQQGDLATAYARTRESIALYEKLGLPRQLINARRQSGRLLVKLGRIDEGIADLQVVLKMSENLKARGAIANAYRELARAYEARGELRAAYDWQQKLLAENEAILGERARQQLVILNSRYQAERRQLEIEALRRDQEVKAVQLAQIRLQRYALIALLGLGLVALAAVVSRQRIKRRAEQRILAEATAARQAAEQADTLKTQLVGMVSHDIRGPVGNIRTMAEELRDDASLPPGDPRVELIVHEAQHVLGLAQDLLDAAALEAGRLRLETGPVDLADIVRATLGRVGLTAGAKGQKVEFHPPAATDGIVTGDAARLIQVVTNLLSNAIKYSPRNSTVRVSVARLDGRVRLAVQDEGPGIPTENLPHLFQPFSRLSARPTGGESSHGLGLSIVHDLVRLHGGGIFVDSRPGHGTTFTVELPAYA